MSNTEQKNSLYGVVAEFSSTDAILRAASKIRDAGYTKTDGFSSIPVHGLDDALGYRRSRMAGLVLIGGTCGCLTGLTLQWWVSCVAYPHIVAGKPFFSWPNFIPVIFECTVLFSALTGVFGMLIRNGLPKLYHPLFGVPGFDRATTDKFFLCIEAVDPKFHREQTLAFMRGLGADKVTEVSNHADDVK